MKHTYVAVIQAGGQGTRMRPLTGDRLPKPMLMLNGKPMLEWQVEKIAAAGICELVMITGHLGEQIEAYFQDGAKWGVRIRYIREEQPLGSAGALGALKPLLGQGATDFLLVFADVMFDLDFDRMFVFHESRPALATLLAHPNAHPYDSDVLVADESGVVKEILPKNQERKEWYCNLVNAGIYVLSGELLNQLPGEGEAKLDLERDVLSPRLETGRIYAYPTPEYVKDAGTPERFEAVCREQAAGIWERKNLKNKQRCVFLDRDGTVNQYRGLIWQEEQFELEEGAAEAIRLLNQAGWLAILVTNQPVVARGMCGMEDVNRIHRKMQTLLGEQGAWLDDIVFCPHHPDRGYPEENKAYKVVCGCRKPATGMIDRMVKKYNIDIDASWIAGDSTIDIQTGKNAGLKTVLLSTGQAGLDGKYAVLADRQAKNLPEAVRMILG